MLALIDGDIIAHACCERLWYANPTECFEIVKMIYKDYSVLHTESNVQKCLDEFHKSLDIIIERTFSDSFLMAVKGDNNYRNEMYPEYKMNRHKDPTKINPLVSVIRRIAVERELAIDSDGCEADDMLSVWAYQAREANEEYVIASIDKDLKCVPGNHFNIRKHISEYISDIDAKKFFYKQLLMGDPTDNIPGVPKIGPVKAAAAIDVIQDEGEMQEIVVAHYIDAFDTDWLNWLLSNGKMLYLQKSRNDYFKCSDWPIVKTVMEGHENTSSVVASTNEGTPVDTSHIKIRRLYV